MLRVSIRFSHSAHIQDESVEVAILRNDRHRAVVCRNDAYAARRWACGSRQDLDQLALAVAVNPGDAHDFAGRQREIDSDRATRRPSHSSVRFWTVSSGVARLSVGARGTPDGAAASVAPLISADRLISPIIRRASSASLVSAAIRSATTRPWRSTVTRSATAIASASLCVTMIMIRPSPRSRRSSSRNASEFGRREHAGRFVEDQHARIETKRAQDFEPHPFADGATLNRRTGRRQIEAEPRRERRARAGGARRGR